MAQLSGVISTRPATLDDAPALALMLVHFNEGYDDRLITAKQAEARLRATEGIETTIIAQTDEAYAGFACLRLIPYMSGDELYAELSDLFVEAEYRQRGVGRMLMAHIERLAREGGADQVQLITGFDNPTAQAFYQSLGYADWALAMKKNL